MWASILAAIGRLIAELVKSGSGPIVGVAAPVVPDALLFKWNDFVRDRL